MRAGGNNATGVCNLIKATTRRPDRGFAAGARSYIRKRENRSRAILSSLPLSPSRATMEAAMARRWNCICCPARERVSAKRPPFGRYISPTNSVYVSVCSALAYMENAVAARVWLGGLWHGSGGRSESAYNGVKNEIIRSAGTRGQMAVLNFIKALGARFAA